MRYVMPMMLVCLVGCGAKLNYEKSIEVDNGGLTTFIDPTRGEQKLSITASSPGTPIDVYVFLEKDKDKAEKEIFARKLTGGTLLASQEKTESASLTATIPAKETAAIVVKANGFKKANVKLKVTN